MPGGRIVRAGEFRPRAGDSQSAEDQQSQAAGDDADAARACQAAIHLETQTDVRVVRANDEYDFEHGRCVYL